MTSIIMEDVRELTAEELELTTGAGDTGAAIGQAISTRPTSAEQPLLSSLPPAWRPRVY